MQFLFHDEIINYTDPTNYVDETLKTPTLKKYTFFDILYTRILLSLRFDTKCKVKGADTNT